MHSESIKIKILVFIKDKKGRILLIKEKTEKNLHPAWNFIRGTYDIPGENLQDTVQREIFEEVGIKNIKNLKYISCKEFHSQSKSRFYFIFSGLSFEEPDLTINNNSNEDIREANWFTVEEIKNKQSSEFVDKLIWEIAQNFIDQA